MANNNKDVHSSGKLFVGILFLMFFTLFFGVFIGFLFAPQTGRKFREAIKYWLNEMVERGKFGFEEVKVLGSELIDKSKEKVEHLSSKILSDSEKE
ncbi:MAG: YtxH domain-containing protein, partial [Actinomycetota bacterium]|nr:YtxH domain-containing protein [Actinomycetota bacterium]